MEWFLLGFALAVNLTCQNNAKLEAYSYMLEQEVAVLETKIIRLEAENAQLRSEHPGKRDPCDLAESFMDWYLDLGTSAPWRMQWGYRLSEDWDLNQPELFMPIPTWPRAEKRPFR